jgi:hypothetical protein
VFTTINAKPAKAAEQDRLLHALRALRSMSLLRRPTSGDVVVRDAQFPKADDYFFKPLNEHVAVFQLDDQACDDAVCFTPQSAPVTWTIGLRALDRERSAKQP